MASSFLSSLPADAPDAVLLAARLADAERQIAALQVELAIANERAESFRALAAAKDEIITAALHSTPLARNFKGAADAADQDGATELELRLHTSPLEIPGGGAAAGAHERQYNAPLSRVCVIVDTHRDQADRRAAPRLAACA